MVGGMMEGFEISCIGRYQDSFGLRTPLEQVGVSRVFTELVFRVNHVVAAFSGQPLVNPTDVFVEQKSASRSLHGFFGVQGFFSHVLERCSIFRFERPHLVNVSVIVGERFIHVCKGHI
jgi:hypothetical protein